jgi:hypothetical protein
MSPCRYSQGIAKGGSWHPSTQMGTQVTCLLRWSVCLAESCKPSLGSQRPR